MWFWCRLQTVGMLMCLKPIFSQAQRILVNSKESIWIHFEQHLSRSKRNLEGPTESGEQSVIASYSWTWPAPQLSQAPSKIATPPGPQEAVSRTLSPHPHFTCYPFLISKGRNINFQVFVLACPQGPDRIHPQLQPLRVQSLHFLIGGSRPPPVSLSLPPLLSSRTSLCPFSLLFQ